MNPNTRMPTNIRFVSEGMAGYCGGHLCYTYISPYTGGYTGYISTILDAARQCENYRGRYIQVTAAHDYSLLHTAFVSERGPVLPRALSAHRAWSISGKNGSHPMVVTIPKRYITRGVHKGSAVMQSASVALPSARQPLDTEVGYEGASVVGQLWRLSTAWTKVNTLGPDAALDYLRKKVYKNSADLCAVQHNTRHSSRVNPIANFGSYIYRIARDRGMQYRSQHKWFNIHKDLWVCFPFPLFSNPSYGSMIADNSPLDWGESIMPVFSRTTNPANLPVIKEIKRA